MIYFKNINLYSTALIQEFVLDDIFQKLKSMEDFSSQVRIKHKFPSNLEKEVNENLKVLNIPPLWYAQSYLRRKNTKQEIHIDGDSEIISSAINIPLRGANNSKFNWYTGDYKIYRMKHKDIIYQKIQWLTKPILAETLQIDKPYLIRVDKPHSAESSSEEDRWILTMRFKGNPNFDLLCT